MLDWLIIGGGLHGRFVARAIGHAAPDAALAVLDTRAPLTAWCRRAQACGMLYLRSAGAHHLGSRADDLRRFAALHGYDAADWLGYYRRPSRALFEAHGHHALAGTATLTGHATALEKTSRGWRVHTRDGACHRAKRVVLALGPELPYRPVWGGDAEHVYDSAFDFDAAGDRVVVVGGGISGAQLALRFQAADRRVCWVTRAAPRPAGFDSDPCYAGPKCLAPFARLPMADRTQALATARRPGTLPPDLMAGITAALAAGKIAWRRGDIAAATDTGLRLGDGRSLAADRIVLATGFQPHPGADSLLGRCIAQQHLSTDTDGHVVVNEQLEAAPGLHLVGRPASLQLGPMAGNIRGARLAGQRLAALAANARRQTAHRA